MCTSFSNPLKRIARSLPLLLAAMVAHAEKLELQDRDVIAFMGGTTMVQAMESGYLECLLTHHHPALNLRFRDFSWEADTVYAQATVSGRWRRSAFGDLEKQLRAAGTTLAVLHFGQMECLQGPAELDAFRTRYGTLIEQVKRVTRRVVLLTPIPFSGSSETVSRKRDLAQYAHAITDLAKRHSCTVADLTSLEIDAARSGEAEVQRRLGEHLAKQVGLPGTYAPALEPLRQAIRYKNALWSRYQRPKNWKCLFGDDGRRVFSIGRGKGTGLTLKSEWEQLPSLVAFAEKRIQSILQGKEAEPERITVESLAGAKEADIQSEKAAFTLDERLQVNCFASEAEGIPCPLQMRWDSKGRLYVISTTAYPQLKPGQAGDDRIVILQDTDGDGVADRSTVFADGLDIPTGLALGHGGVYLAHGTQLLFLADSDGDDRADVKKVLLSGLGTGDTHQTANSLSWSPGGMLLFGQGDGIESRVETPDGIVALYTAGFYRYHPGSRKLEAILNNWGGPANPWGMVFDDWGQCFSCDGAGGIDYITQAMLPNQRRRKIRRIGSPGGYCGMDMISSPRLPADLQGHFLVGDFKRNAIRRFATKEKGSGFAVEWKGDLLKSSHRNFRPVDIRMGPDGAIYIADWYNPVTCHQDDYFRDPNRDKTHGRIWRISLKGQGAGTTTDLSSLDHAALVRQLASPERWNREQARREMTCRDPDALAPLINDWVSGLEASTAGYEHHLYEALAALATINRADEKLLQQASQAKDHRLRAFAAEWTGHWHRQLKDPLARLQDPVRDAHPLVRLKAILGCAHVPDARAMEVAARVTELPMDEGIRYAFAQAADHLSPYWIHDSRLFKNEPRHRAAALAQVDAKTIRKELLELAAKRSLTGASRRSILQGIVNIGNPDDLRMILDPKTYTPSEAVMQAELLDDLRMLFNDRGTKPSGSPARILENLVEEGPAIVKASAMLLAHAWNEEGLQAHILALAKDATQDTGLRSTAISALAGSDGETISFLREMIEQGDPDLQLSALQTLCEADLQAAALLAAEKLSRRSTPDYSVSLRYFLARSGGSETLAGALATRDMSKATARRCLQVLQLSGRSDEALTAVLDQALERESKALPYDPAYIRTLATEAGARGDAGRGKQLFFTTGCIACHRVEQHPAFIGPDLNAIGTAMTPEQIIEEVLWPARVLKEGYSMLLVTTHDGKVHQGYARPSHPSSDALRMRHLAQDSPIRIPRNRIRSIGKPGSAMPRDVARHLTRKELRDLVKYLTTLGDT
jgi:putative heme-binding domain-containing protein